MKALLIDDERLARNELRRLLAVVAAVGNEVLQDQLLDVAVLAVQLGELLERGDAVGRCLADPHEDPARKRDPQLTGIADRLQPELWILRRGAGVRRQIIAQRLEHQALRSGHLAQPGEVAAREGAEVRVREQATLERPLATPDHVGDEILEAELRELRRERRMVRGIVAGQDQELLDVAMGGMVEQRQNLVRLVQVRLVGGEGAVLAVRDAGA